jgi:phosphate transport system substrate-binding protein
VVNVSLWRSSLRIGAFGLAVLLLTAACGGAQGPGSRLEGDVRIDGSSTVFPISEAMAEEFQKKNPRVRITVGISGTGGGFTKFCNGETDISDASRPIRESEKTVCRRNGIEYVELQVAYDGLSLVVNRANTWVDCLTTAELKKIWDAGSRVNNWKDVRAGMPDVELKLFGPGTDSGTFDYFTEAINGKEKQSRSDFTASEDDNVLVQGVSGTRGALGYFGYAYYNANRDSLKLLKVDGGSGCIEPSARTVEDGVYKPLSRPIFIYPKKESLRRPEVSEFVRFYLGTDARGLISEVGYIAAPDRVYTDGLAKIATAAAQ